ncbi:MAG: VCBS repeat-containing protein [Elusimicrobia bacterium]|nr:VCBS repeat-containing protein [Elusimicrobiota bacterium]
MTNADTGAVLAGVAVDLLNPADESVVTSVVTDAFGTYTLSPGAGTYHIRTQPTGYFPSMRFSYSYDAVQTLTLNFALQVSGEIWRDDFSAVATPPTGWTATFGATQFTSAGNIMLFRTAVTGGPGVYHGVTKSVGSINSASYPYLSIRHKYSLSAGSFGSIHFIYDHPGPWSQRISVADNPAAAAPWQDRTFPALVSYTNAFLLQGDGPAGSNTVDHYFDYIIAHARARGYIRGTVRDSLGLPLSGARVQVLRGNAVVAEGLTDASGNYDVAVATQAIGTPYTLRARLLEYYDAVSGDLAVANQAVTTADLTLLQSLAGIWFPGSGKDGVLNLTTALTENPTRTNITGSVASGTKAISVASLAGFAPGDLVLIIQMILGGAGDYEFARVATVSGTLNLTRGTRNIYQTAGAQVIKVSEYSHVTVANGGAWQAAPWDGTTGGVLAAVVRGSVTVMAGGLVTAQGAGFRGAPTATITAGTRGEGETGAAFPTPFGNSANGAGGGGGGVQSACGTAPGGGGGGGHSANGNNGGGLGPGLGGGLLGNTTLSKVLLGGGGGAGGINTSPGTPNGDGGGGGRGGGIFLLVTAGDVSLSGGVNVSGISGGAAGAGAGCATAGGGGGAGGSVRIVSTATVGFGGGLVQTLAGGGATGNNGGGAGGVGGAGRIAVLKISTPTLNASPAFDATSPDTITLDDPYTAPGAVTNLRVSAVIGGGLDVSSFTVRLTWSAPGADASSTTIQNGAFTVRYSPSPILSDLAFDAAPFTINIATAGVVPGSTQTIHIGPLDPTVTWYFAIKTTDTWAMTSSLSNPATAQARQTVMAGSGGRSYGITWGDYDRDGVFDLGVGNGATDGSSADQLERFVKVFPDGRIVGTTYGSGDTTGVAFGDLDKDGMAELVIANGFGAVAANGFYRGGGGDVTFTGAVDKSLGVALADFDNDGDLDIFYANDGSASEVVFNDDGTWTRVPIPGTGALRSIDAAAADFDGDGRMDVAVAAEGGGSAYVVFNEGGRNFSTASLAGATGFGRGVAAADLNGDGRPDIALAYTGSGDEMVVRNDGNRSFGAAVPIGSTGGNSERIAAADYDNDGDVDLVVTNLDIPNRVLRNNGSFSFSVYDLPKTPRSRGVAWADYDDDGDADLAVANDGGAAASDAADEFLIRNDTGVANAAPVPPGPEDIAVMFAYDPTGSTLTFAWTGGAYDGATSTEALNFDIAVSTYSLDLHSDPRHFVGTLRSFVVPPADRVPGFGFHQRPGFKDWTGEGFPFHAVQISSKGAYANSALQWNTTYYLRVATIDPGLARSSWSAQKAFYLPDPCATNYSGTTGNWSNRNTWATGVVPYSCTPVIIQAAHAVTVDITTATVSTTTVYGRLAFDRAQNSTLTMVGGGLDIRGGGVLDMGTGASPVTGKAVLVLAAGGGGVRHGLTVHNGGKFWAHGSTRTPFGYAVESIPAGATSFKVSASSADGWAAGDMVAIGATGATGPNGVEFAAITAVSGGDPRTVSLGSAVAAARVFTTTAPIVIVNLSRDVVVRSSGTASGSDTAFIVSHATSSDGFLAHDAEFYKLGALGGGAAADEDGVRLLGPAHVSSSAFHQGHAGVLAASAAVVFEGNSFVKNAGYGLTLTSLALGASVHANTSVANAAGGFGGGASGSVFSWNIACSNGLRGFDGFRIRSWFTDNTVCLNANGGMVSGSNDDEISLVRNRVFGNAGDGISVTGARFVLEGNSSYDNVGDGVEASGPAAQLSSNSAAGNAQFGFNLVNGSHLLYGNRAYGNSLSGFGGTASSSTLVDNYSYANARYGFDIRSDTVSWVGGALGRDPSLAPAANNAGAVGCDSADGVKRMMLGRAWVNGAFTLSNFAFAGDVIASFSHDHATGTLRIQGDYVKADGMKFDYSTVTYGAWATPALRLRGDQHSATVYNVSDSSAVAQMIVIERRGGIWHIDGSVSGPDMGTFPGSASGFDIPSTPMRQFTLDFAQGPSPQEGDRVAFILGGSSQDSGVQKRILFSDTNGAVNGGRSRLRAGPAQPLSFRGVPGYPTVLDRLNAGATFFTLVASGPFTAEHASFTNLDQNGLQLQFFGQDVVIATTTFDHMGVIAGEAASFLSMTSQSAMTNTATFYNLAFGDSRSTASASAAANMRAIGPGVYPTWTLHRWSGAMGGEARDDEPFDLFKWAPFTPATAASTFTAVTTASIAVQWLPGENDSDIFYEVQANTYPFANGAIASSNPVFALAGTVGGLLPNTSYFLRVFAANQWGNNWWEADYSMPLQFAATATLAIAPSTGPAGTFSVFGTSATLGWAANPAVPLSSSTYGYLLEASSTDFNGQGSVYSSATTSNFVSTLTVIALERNTTYYFRVGSLNEFGVPNFIALGSSSTLASALVPNFVGVFVSSVTAGWPALPPAPQAAGAEGYRLEASSTNFGSAAPGGAVLSSATGVLAASSLTIAGLSPYVTYYFRVGALNWGGAANFSVLGATVTSLFKPAAVPSAALPTFGAAWADADGDGDLDLAIANAALDSESVLRNDGVGGFTRFDVANSFGNSRGLAWGDFDRDGDLDFAVANGGGEDEKVMRNTGGMVFQESAVAGSAGDSRGIAAGDYDNDGDLDLAVGNAGGQDEVLLRNDGGNFVVAAFPATGGDSNAVAWGDYDNDGDLDLAIANAGGEDEVLVRNDSGSFVVTGLLAGSGGDSVGLAWGDLDGDGDLDLAVADAGAASFVMRNDGGAFVKVMLPSVVGSHKGVAWGDLDNDGDLDLVFTSSGGAPTVMFNQGGASFIARQMPEGGPATAGVSFGDYDGDGDLDVGLGTENASLDPKVLRNDSQPGNTPPTAPSGGFNASFTELAPFSSSGVLRLSWNPGLDGQTPQNLMKYWVRVGASAPGSSETLKVPPLVTVDGCSGGSWGQYSTRFGAGNALKLVVAKETTSYWAVVSEDLMGARSAESAAQTTGLVAPRAVTDLVVLARVSTGLGASTMTVTLNWTAPGADGSVGALTGVYDIRWSSSAPLTSTNAFVAAPFVAQVATAAVIPGSSQWYTIPDLAAYATWYFAMSTLDGATYPEGVRSGLSNPATSQSYAEPLTGAATARRAAWGDFDGDGDLDLALAQAGNDSVYRNDGGTFTPVLVTAGGDSYAVAWGDYDGDGDLDLLVGNVAGADEYLLTNTPGGLTPGSIAGTGQDTYDAAWADYDNDGDLDAALANYAAGVLLLRNKGDGTFAQVLVPGIVGVTGVAWGDYDGDGYLDLAVASETGDEALYRNDAGVLTLVTPNPFAGSGGNTWKAAWGDLDNDGRLDAVFTNYNNGGVRIYRNTGGGTFAGTLVPGTGNAYEAALGDVDGDGDLDIALSRGGAGEHELILRNDGGTWSRVELSSATAGGSLGAAWGDYDGDGDPDLAVVNGDVNSLVARNDRGVVNTAPVPPFLSASDLAFEYDLQGATLTLKWDAGDYDGGKDTDSLHYQLAGATLPMTVAGDSKRLTGPSSFVVPWQFGSPGWGTHINTAYKTWPGDATPKLGRLLRVAVPEGRLANDATYYFRVQTIDAELARGGWSNEVSTFVFAAVPPAGRGAAVHASSATVSYSTVTGGTRYIAEAFSDAAFSVLAASAATGDLAVSSLALAGLGPNTTFYLRMGVLYSRTTAYAAAVPASAATPAALPATAASTFPVVNSASMTVVWGANANPFPTLYTVVLSTDSVWPNPSTMTVTLSTAPTAGPAATLQGLSNYTTYYLFVRAVGHDGVPTAYVPLGSTMTAVDTTPPAPLTDLRVATAAMAGAFVDLAWTAPGDDGGLNSLDAGEYRIQYATYAVAFASADAQVFFSTGGAAPGDLQGRRIPSLSGGSTYYFRAWTRDDVGQWAPVSNGATVYLSWTAGAVGGGGKQVSAAVGPDGKHHVFYNDGGNNLIHASRMSGQPWTTETAATGATETGVRNASVVDSSGTIHLLMAYGTPAGNLGYASWNGTWSSVWLVDGSGTAIDALAMAVDAGGVVHTAHSRAGTLYYSRRSAAGSWNTTNLGPSQAGGGVALALRPDGAPLILHSNAAFKLRLLDWQGSGFVQRVIDDAATNTQSVGLVYDRDGLTAVAFKNSVDNTLRIDTAAAPSGPWAPALARAMGTGNPYLSFAIDGTGGGELLFMENTAARSLTSLGDLRRIRVGEGFSDELLGPAGGLGDNAQFPAVFLDAAGFVHAAYPDSAGTGVLVASSAFVTAPPPGPLAPGAFGAAAVYQTSVSWSWTDRTPNEAGFRIYGGTSPPYALVAGTATLGPGAVAHTETGLFANATYYRYAVVLSSGGAGMSVGSTVVTGVMTPQAAASTFTAVSSYAVTTAWSGASNSPGTLYQAQFSSDVFSQTLSTAPEGAPAAVFAAVANTTYSFRVRAVARDGTPTPYLATVSTVTSIELPSEVLVDAVSSTTLLLRATAPPAGFTNLAAGVSGLRFVVGGSTLAWAAGSSMTFVTGLTPNTPYTLFARARNLEGTETADTPTVSTYTLAAVPSTATPVFAGVFVSSVSLQWTHNGNPGATEFRVGASTAADFSGSSDTVTAWLTGTSTQPASLTPNTSYYFRVQARNGLGAETAYADLGSTVTLAAQPGLAAAPFSPLGQSSVTVNWTLGLNPPGTEFMLKASTASDFTGTVLSAGWLSALTTTFTGLSADTTYYWTVGARNRAGLVSQLLSLGAQPTLPYPPAASTEPFHAVWVTSANVQWAANGSPAWTQYQAEASTDPAYGTSHASGWTAFLSTTVTGLTGDATYFWRVRARGFAGVPVDYLALGSPPQGAADPVAPHFSMVGPASAALEWGTGGNRAGTGSGAWSLGLSLPAARERHAATLLNGRLYVTGGIVSGTASAEVWSAPVSQSGAVGTWSRHVDMPAPRESHAVVVQGGRLYVLGGFDGVAKDTVYWAPVSPDGSVGDWRQGRSLPAARFKLAAVTDGGWLYAIGGDNGVISQSTVYAAPLAADGSIGAWSSATALPSARNSHAAAVSEGFVYVAGGLGAGLSATAWSAPLAGASVGPWTAQAALGTAVFRHSLLALPGRLLAVGGHDGNAAVGTLQQAAILGGGTLGAWGTYSGIPLTRFGHAAVLTGNDLLVVGGSDGAIATADTFFSRVSGTEYLTEFAQDTGFSVAYGSTGWRAGAALELSGLTPNTTYYARAKARTQAGVPGAFVDAGSTVTLAAVPASAPSTFTAVFAGSMTLTWAANNNPAGTEFMTGLSTSSDFTTTALSGWTTAVSSTVYGLSPNTTYFVAAVARNKALTGTPALALGATMTLAAVPQDSSFTAVGGFGFTAVWSTAANPAGTRYEAQISLADTFSPVAGSSITVAPSATFQGLVGSSTYYMRVRALNGRGAPSAFSATTWTATGLDVSSPAVVGGFMMHQSEAAGTLLALWTSPGDDGSSGVLPSGSRFYLQWAAGDPAAVSWSTANAQLSVSTGPLAAGSSSSMLVPGLPAGSWVTARVWTLDDGGMVSDPSSMVRAFASPFDLARLDGTGTDAGRGVSLAVDRSGDAHASYTAGTIIQELRYIRRTGGVWSVPEGPDPGIPAADTVVAVDAAGVPQVLYRNAQTGQLRHARRAGSWGVSAVASGNLVPGGLVLDATGQARITYYDASTGDLLFAARDAGVWQTEVVDSAGDVGRTSSLALDAGGTPYTAYFDATNGNLKFASRTAPGAWAVSTVDPAAAVVGSAPALALDGLGGAFVAYLDSTAGDLKVARFDGSAWSSAVVDSLSTAAAVGGLALDGAGNPLVSYYDGAGGDLLFARFDGIVWSTGTLDSRGDRGSASSLSVDAGGEVQVLHYDATAGDLYSARWSAGLAAPYGGNARGRLQAPASLTGVVASSTTVLWTWTDSAASELGWRVYGSLSSTGPYALVAGTAAIPATAGTGTNRSYTETGLSMGTTYYRYVVAVASGGFAASPVASTVPFVTADVNTPGIDDFQNADPVWRRSAGALYNVDFTDTGGSLLSSFQVRASTVPNGTGPVWVDYTDVAGNILSDSYTADWALPAPFFAAMADGVTNYISVRVFDGAGNSAVSTDTFSVMKDTTPPALQDWQGGDSARRAAGGTLYDVDARDPASGLERFQYSVSLNATTGDAGVLGWTDIPLAPGATSYAAVWPVAFAALVEDATNYVSVRAWDMAGSTASLVDAFFVVKDTAGPHVGITLPASAFRSVLTLLSGTAGDAAGVGGVEVALETAPAGGGLWWNGGSFASAVPVWLAASGTASWTFAALPAWTDGGSFRLVARATDTLGNYSAPYSTADFSFDASSPTAGVTTPLDAATPAALPAISGTALDSGGAPSGLSLIEVRLSRVADGLFWNWTAGGWSSSPVSTTPVLGSPWTVPVPEALRSNLAHNASYFISVRAADGSTPVNTGSFAVGSTFTWQDTTPPAALTDLTGLSGPSPGEIRLAWTAPGEDGMLGGFNLGQYRIHYSTDAAAVFSTAAAQVAFSTGGVVPGAFQGRLLSGLSAGSTYHLRVFMSDDSGNWSALSNGATALATPQPFNKITGRVMKVSSEGVTGVLLEAFDAAGARVSSAYSLADGSGTYSLDSILPGVYRVQASWTAGDVTSSVWIDNIAVGSYGVDFFLEVSYTLSSLTGSLGSVSGQALGTAGFLARAADNSFKDSRVQLLRGGGQVAEVKPDPTGRWVIPNLLPGKYAVRAFNGLEFSEPLPVELGEGETREVVFVFDPLPEAQAFAFPNPARERTTFRFVSGLPGIEAQVSVFDIAGVLVKEIPGSAMAVKPGGLYHAVWDLTNDAGESVASGVYLFMVKVRGSNGQTGKVVKKLAIVR